MFSVFLLGDYNTLYNPAGSGIVAVIRQVSGFRTTAEFGEISINLVSVSISSVAIPISTHHRRSIEPKCRLGNSVDGIVVTLLNILPPNVISSGILIENEVRLREGEGVRFESMGSILYTVAWEEY